MSRFQKLMRQQRKSALRAQTQQNIENNMKKERKSIRIALIVALTAFALLYVVDGILLAGSFPYILLMGLLAVTVFLSLLIAGWAYTTYPHVWGTRRFYVIRGIMGFYLAAGCVAVIGLVIQTFY